MRGREGHSTLQLNLLGASYYSSNLECPGSYIVLDYEYLDSRGVHVIITDWFEDLREVVVRRLNCHRVYTSISRSWKDLFTSPPYNTRAKSSLV
jgi:hypothetical protein